MSVLLFLSCRIREFLNFFKYIFKDELKTHIYYDLTYWIIYIFYNQNYFLLIENP